MSSRSSPSSRPRPSARREIAASASYPPLRPYSSSSSLNLWIRSGSGPSPSPLWPRRAPRPRRRDHERKGRERSPSDRCRDLRVPEPETGTRCSRSAVPSRRRADVSRVTHEHRDKRGLASAVTADEADLLCGTDDERCVLHERARADVDRERRDREHWSYLTGPQEPQRRLRSWWPPPFDRDHP